MNELASDSGAASAYAPSKTGFDSFDRLAKAEDSVRRASLKRMEKKSRIELRPEGL